jgi:hypothetical protein
MDRIPAHRDEAIWVFPASGRFKGKHVWVQKRSCDSKWERLFPVNRWRRRVVWEDEILMR